MNKGKTAIEASKNDATKRAIKEAIQASNLECKRIIDFVVRKELIANNLSISQATNETILSIENLIKENSRLKDEKKMEIKELRSEIKTLIMENDKLK